MHNNIGDSSKEGFQKLIEEVQPRLLRFFLSRRVPREDALDLTQDSLLKAYRSRDNFRGKSHDELMAWTFMIARNTWMNWQRNQGASKRMGTQIPIEQAFAQSDFLVSSDRSPVDAVINNEDRQALWTAIESLPTRSRQCMLFCLRGLTYRETALALRISQGTVKAHMHEAKKLLRSLLKDFTAPEAG